MFKKTCLIIIFLSVVLLASCTNDGDTLEETIIIDTEISTQKTVTSISGLEDISVSQYEYFNPIKNVMIINESDENIAYLLEIEGHVNYGVVGQYSLTYKLNYGDESISENRIVSVESTPIVRESASRNSITDTKIILDEGSYRVGSASNVDHPINPQLINQDLLDKAVPSNGWWTSLLAANYGASNGIYTNPLRSSFSNAGVEITNPGAGFVQYWNNNNLLTMANFSLTLPDLFLKTSNLNSSYQTHVVDYSDSTVSVAMRNVGNQRDQMVVTYSQGSPYAFVEVADAKTPNITLGTGGVLGYEFFTVNGTQINDNSYEGNGIVVKMVQKHIGYDTYLPAQVGQPIYANRYFLVSTPEETNFTILNNKISMDLGSENYYSVAAIESLDDADFFHDHAYTKTLIGNTSYVVDEKESVVLTNYDLSVQFLKTSNTNEPLQYLMPHHYQNSDVELTDYIFETIRGELKLMIGSHFGTQLSFYGLLPAMTAPTNSEFSQGNMQFYLNDLDSRTEISDTENFLNDEGPYWNSKAIYPLTQGIIIADQLNYDSLKQSFITKLRYILTDWFTYSSTTDEKYLYYNEAWGSVYYSNNDFNTASELSDHSFTHGYLVYAASVLSMYDNTFYTDYKDVVQLLLNDYMYPTKDSYEFSYLRSFDAWAGHTWAHGFGTFAEGNNIESSSEAIQSWLGGYLWSLQTGDTKLRDAAIYGFVHELSSAKTYMFDYSEEVFKDDYSDYAAVAGMIWGGKYDYATWFGANPTFIYGIQWLPNGEYLSNYAVTPDEKTKLSEIYAKYLSAKNGTIDTWYANMWSIQALINPTTAISLFNANLILEDDYPSDLSQTYYLLHALKSYGTKDSSYYMVIHDHVSSSIYKDTDGLIHALIWNPSNENETIIFKNHLGEQMTYTITSNRFESIILNF